MRQAPNTLRWDGTPGHYEVYYLSATDPVSGVGLWIRYTMLAPLDANQEPSCALWLMAMDPAGGEGGVFARKQTLPIAAMEAGSEPFSLRISDCTLDDHGMSGSFQDVSFDLHWQGRLGPYEHVHPILSRARIAKTVLCLPHADLQVSGTVAFAERRLELDQARGGQAHLWGSKHAARWAWLHCNDLRDGDGDPVADSFIDGVSVYVPRFGRELGPSTPVVARIDGEDFSSTSPLRVLANDSRFGLSDWNLQATDGRRRLRVVVDAPRDRLVGVTYRDPDGEPAYCYNTEVASLRVGLWERRGRGRSAWSLRRELTAPGVAHFEYGQREPLADVGLALS
jgi:hypothetical protein